LQNRGPGTMSEQAGIDHTHVPPLGIWAQTNIVKQNIPKRPCTAHQHAQILYWTHYDENIDANEIKYPSTLFEDT
jgi:hypothetical protein